VAGANIGGFVEADVRLHDVVEVVCGVIAAFRDAPAVTGSERISRPVAATERLRRSLF
jgi:hypothetical protein